MSKLFLFKYDFGDSGELEEMEHLPNILYILYFPILQNQSVSFPASGMSVPLKWGAI